MKTTDSAEWLVCTVLLIIVSKHDTMTRTSWPFKRNKQIIKKIGHNNNKVEVKH